MAIALHVDHQRGKHPCGHPLPHGGVIAHLNFQIVRGLAGIHDVGDARVGAVLRAVHRGDKGKGRLAGVVGIRHNGDTAGEDTVVLELGGIRAALHPDLHLLQAADILLRGIRRSLRVLAVTFYQNDNIRERAIQLPLVVDILQSKSCVGVPLQPCLFVHFFGVRIVLVLVSGQIDLDDGLQNTVVHVGRRVAQVKAAGDPPVCLAVTGCLALDGDKVCGNVEPRKIIFCNCGADGGDLEGFTVCTGLVGGSFLHTGDDGVFRAGLQVGEMAAALPVRPIVYGILPGTVFCYFNVSSRLGNQVEDRRGGAVRLLDGSHGCLNRAGLRAAAHLAGDFLVDVRLHQCIGLARADGVCLACVVPLVGQGAGVVGVGHIGGEGLIELRRTVDVHRAGKRVGCSLPGDLEGAWHRQFSRRCWSTIRRLSFTAVVGIGHLIYALVDRQSSPVYCSTLPLAGFPHIKARQLGEIEGSRCGGNCDGIRAATKLYRHGGAAIIT